jgi:hypothetical protein
VREEAIHFVEDISTKIQWDLLLFLLLGWRWFMCCGL